MKLLKHLLFITLIVFTACKSNKNTVDKTGITHNLSAKKVAKKHLSESFDKKTVYSKLSVNYKDAQQDRNFSVKLKIKKDEVIWLKGTYFITVFKAKITPTKVRFYSPYKKNYFDGNFAMINTLLGVEVNFKQLQNMLLGQALLDVKSEKQNLEIIEKSYRLSPKNQPNLFDIFFFVNTEHFKLNKQSLVNSVKNKRLDVLYPEYLKKDGEFYPKKINIIAKDNNEQKSIEMTTRSVEFNTELSMPFQIPSGYKEIKL